MSEKVTTTRRQPRQRRSQQRVHNIIAATGELLDEVGYAKLTTNAIAQRAKTSIGSLYQFFPNKDAVVSQLVQGYRGELHEFLESSISVEMARASMHELVSVVVDGIEELRQRSPGFGSMLWLRHHDIASEETTIQLDKDIMEPLNQLLAIAYPEISEERRRLCMQVATESTKALLFKVAGANPLTQASMREELKRMLGLYLNDCFASNGASDSS